MIWIFLAATIFGGAFLIPMILGGLDSDIGDGFGGDVDVDVDVDLDVDLDVDVGDGPLVDVDGGDTSAGSGAAAGGILGGALGSIFASLISFRTVVFFSGFFGTAGLVFNAIGYSNPVTVATALLIGSLAAVINSLLFGLIKSSQPNSQVTDRILEGRWAKVVLPMSETRRGRIRIDLSGQPQYMVAKALDGSSQQFDVGASVVVVKIENGTALVSSLAGLETGEES